MDLDAGSKPPKGVETPSQLLVFVGDPPRQLSIFTGVAITDFESNGDLDRDEVRIRLGRLRHRVFQLDRPSRARLHQQ